MKDFKPLDKLYISKNVNSKSLEEMAVYLNCTEKEVKHCYETMKLNGEFDKYRVSNYVAVKEEEKQLETKRKAASTKGLVDLNQFLYTQLESLSKDNFTEEELTREIAKTKAIVSVSQTIINNAKILLDADKHFNRQSQLVQSVLISGEDTNDI